MYLRYGLSYRDLAEMIQERGLAVAHTTIYRWVQRYAPEIDGRCKPLLRKTNASYRIDETDIRVRGQCKYLYRAVDSEGQTLEFLRRAKRDTSAATAFSRKTLCASHTVTACVMNVDRNRAYLSAFETMKEEGRVRKRSHLRQSQYLNNVVEQDHRFIKRRVRPMLGFKRFTTAWRTLRGIEIMYAIGKGQVRWVTRGDVVAQARLLSIACSDWLCN